MEDKETRRAIGINFYSILSVLTFIIMGIGATFAYFSASAKGEDMPISASSITVIMNLAIYPLYNGIVLEEDHGDILVKPVLPTNDSDIMKAFDNKCFDYNNNGACLAYTVKIGNEGQAQSGHVVFNATSDDGMTNLKYLILDNKNNYEPLIPPTSAFNNDDKDENDDLGIPIEIAEGETREVTLLLWLSNLNEPQDVEQASSFKGQVSYISNMGSVITGTIDDGV